MKNSLSVHSSILDRFCKIHSFQIRRYPLPGGKTNVCMIAGKDEYYRIELFCSFKKYGTSDSHWKWTVAGKDKRAKADALILENGILWCDELSFSTSIFEDERTIDLSNVNNIESLEIWLDLHDGKA